MIAPAGRLSTSSSRKYSILGRYWPDRRHKEGFSLAPSLTMNYLKNLTTSVLSSTGVSFPFSIGERIPGLEPGSSIWELREGVKKVSRERVGYQVGSCLTGCSGRWHPPHFVHLRCDSTSVAAWEQGQTDVNATRTEWPEEAQDDTSPRCVSRLRRQGRLDI